MKRNQLRICLIAVLMAGLILLSLTGSGPNRSVSAGQGKGGEVIAKPTPTPVPKKTTPKKRTPASNSKTSQPAKSSGDSATAAEMIFWNSIKDSTYPDDFDSYLRKYPNGEFAELAKNRLKILETTKPKPAATPAITETTPANASKPSATPNTATETTAASKPAEPVSAEDYVNRGETKIDAGNYDAAIADFTKAIELDTKNFRAYDDRGIARYSKGDYDGAISDYTKAIELNPKVSSVYDNRGSTREQKGDHDGAFADFSKAVEVDPADGGAQNNLGWFLATTSKDSLRNGSNAVEHALKACELTKWEAPYYIDTLAAAYGEVGNFDEAVKWENKALSFTEFAKSAEAEGARQRLQLYQLRKPFHQGAKSSTGPSSTNPTPTNPSSPSPGSSKMATPPNPPLPLHSFDFVTVALDKEGKLKSRETKGANAYTEDLDGGVKLEMVAIPPGEFMMGSPAGNAYERPQHRVRIGYWFYLGKFEVTQAQWRAVMGTSPSHFKDCDDCPVEEVSWDDAVEFCRKLSAQSGHEYRLPNEAEWEYAARAGTTTRFAFGETITPEIVNYSGDYPYGNDAKGINRQKTVPVGSLGVANAFGLYDMYGNVWEWCKDWFHRGYSGIAGDAPTDGSAWLGGGEQKERVLRGGCWDDGAIFALSTTREGRTPDFRFSCFGFRVVAVARTQ
jgi:formylglycine-generating enzyme required for sulfatase activity/Flp pilus assembly protein TadD